MTTQRQGVRLHLHVCANEKKCDKLCDMKEESEKVVVGSDFFQRNKQQRSH